MTRPPAIFLMGPTASGKTAAAIALADRFPLDIVSVDSAQIYRDMNIGTAKPDAELLARYPHRLLDLLNPTERYSAARFRADALAVMEDIVSKGRVPLLVGGTGLYFRALEQGLSDLPDADAETRDVIDAEAAAKGWPAMHAELAEVDPQSAARISPNDPQRIQRALEVWRLTGKPMGEHWETPARDSDFPYRLLKLAVAPESRAELHRRIEERFRVMLDAGLLNEVRQLKARGDLSPELPALRAVGYRQLWEHLAGDTDFDEAVRRGVVASRRYAKRQMTWLRGEPGLEWFASDAPGLVDRLVKRVEDFLSGA